jgi:hypothetical protein
LPFSFSSLRLLSFLISCFGSIFLADFNGTTSASTSSSDWLPNSINYYAIDFPCGCLTGFSAFLTKNGV